MLGDGLKNPVSARSKSADSSQYSSHHWMIVFAAQLLFSMHRRIAVKSENYAKKKDLKKYRKMKGNF